MLNEQKEYLLLFASSDKILEIWIFEYIQNSKIMLEADAKDATEDFLKFPFPSFSAKDSCYCYYYPQAIKRIKTHLKHTDMGKDL